MSESTPQPEKSPKIPGKRKLWWLPVVWLAFSFIAPYATTYQLAIKSFGAGTKVTVGPSPILDQDAKSKATRSGLVCLLVAMMILALWKLDRAIFVKDTELTGDKKVTAILYCLAFFLWLAWSGIANVMIMASDDISDVLPQLPGLDSHEPNRTGIGINS